MCINMVHVYQQEQESTMLFCRLSLKVEIGIRDVSFRVFCSVFQSCTAAKRKAFRPKVVEVGGVPDREVTCPGLSCK